jgi:tetratricopeptide (TPR) repeat protein
MAEQSFRMVTELRPDLLDGWLELTWALAKLDRLDDAEACAKRAVEIDGSSAAAFGNLASVMLQRGNAEEALPVITRGIALDPSDTKNQMILQQVQDALRPAAEPETDVPWHKRWFRWPR